MIDNIREHMLELEAVVWRHDDLPLQLKRKLCCAIDDIVSFVSNAILEACDHNITEEDLCSEYAKYSCFVDERAKKLISEMVRIWREMR